MLTNVSPRTTDSVLMMQAITVPNTVAMAAPRTPRSSRKIKTGSRMMLRTAPSITDCIPFLAKPWQMMNWFMPVDSRANTVPVR